MGRSGRKCSYEECRLPDNNKRFWWQFVYIIFGVVCLASNESNFSFFPLFTFVAPVLIDLLGCEIRKNKIAQALRQIFIIVNIIIVFVCFCGWYGVIIDIGSAFVVTESAMLCAGWSVPKDYFLWAIVSNVLVPAMYSRVSPCKAKALLPEALLNNKKEEVP